MPNGIRRAFASTFAAALLVGLASRCGDGQSCERGWGVRGAAGGAD